MLLSKDQILNANDIDTRDVEVPEWGGTVRVRALSLKEANEWRRGMLKSVAKTDPKTRGITFEYQFNEQLAELSTIRMLAIACIDAQGNRLFDGPKDIEALSGKNPTPIKRCVDVIKEISGLGDDAADEAEKNSEPSPSDASSSV